MSTKLSMTSEDLDAVCNLVNDLCGVYLDHSKDYLIESRLADIVKRNGCENYISLVNKVRSGMDPKVKEEVIDAITTHETLWFRDNSPFEALRHKIFPELLDEKSSLGVPSTIRVWSSACSTGQEPYSIAMAYADILPNTNDWNLRILGTDISQASVEKAVQGRYTELEIGRGMDQRRLSGYFEREGNEWRVCESARKLCTFETRNLLERFSHLGPFDIIFCRNVAIYFKEEDRKQLFNNLAEVLTPGGWILTGSGESLGELGRNWTAQHHCRAVCYRPNMQTVGA